MTVMSAVDCHHLRVLMVLLLMVSLKLDKKTLLKSSDFCDETKKSPLNGLLYIVYLIVFNRLKPQRPLRFREFLP